LVGSPAAEIVGSTFVGGPLRGGNRGRSGKTYPDYSELEGMHLALSDARIQFQKLIIASDSGTSEALHDQIDPVTI
jgi:hypothetical protein